MGTKRARDQADSAGQQDQHDDRVKEAGGLKVYVQVGDHARENEERAAGGQQPADGAAAAEEEQSDADQHRQERDAERIIAVEVPVAAAHHHLVGQQIASHAGHGEAEQKVAQASRRAADIAHTIVRHQSEDITRTAVCQTGRFMDEILELSATRQARLVRQRTVSAVELVQAHLERIAAVNPRIHAVIEVYDRQAMAAARAADEKLARGEDAGPLCGVPFSIKDSIEVAGAQCTAGTLGRRDAPPSAEDATLVARLREAGAIPIARTNLPDLLFAFESDNLLYGATQQSLRRGAHFRRLERRRGGPDRQLRLALRTGQRCGGQRAPAGRLLWDRRHQADLGAIAAHGPLSSRRRMDRSALADRSDGSLRGRSVHGDAAVDGRRRARRHGGGHAASRSRAGRTRQLRVAFYTDNGFAAADEEVAGVVRAAARALSGEVAVLEEDRPACLGQAYDLEMKLIGADGGDGLREYLRGLGSTQVHPLLTGWLEKLEPYRTECRGLCRVLGGVGCLARGDARIPSPVRCAGVSGLHTCRSAPRDIHAGRELSRLQPHDGL